MTENNVPNHIPNNMDVVVIIDKEKLPEDVRKLLEENLPKDVQDKVLKMLGRHPPVVPGKLDNSTSDNIDNKSDNNKHGNKLEDNKLFAIQTGSVVGNIYTDGIYKKEEDSYVKKKDINHSGGCC